MASHVTLFEDLDRMDADGWAAHLAPDIVMQFANDDPVYGRDACREQATRLFATVRSVSHHLVARWEHGEATIIEAAATFGLRDASEVTVPMVTIYRTGGRGLIADYRVYLDPSPVLHPPHPNG